MVSGMETEIQQYGTVANRALSLDHRVRLASVDRLNQILADTMTLRDFTRYLQETPLAGLGTHLLPTPPSFR